MNPKVIILAGGRGTRLPESAKDKQKVMVEVWGKSVLQHKIEHLAKHGLNDVRLSLGHLAEQVIDFVKKNFPGLEYVVEPEPLGTGGALKHALEDHEKTFVAMSGDILTDCHMIEFLKSAKPCTMTLAQVSNATDYGLAEVADGRIVEFKEKPGINIPGLINAGVYFLEPALIKEFPQKSFSLERDIFPTLVKNNQLHAYIHKGFWIDIGTEERLNSLKNIPNPFET